MGTMGEELQTLRTRAEEAARLETELREATENTQRLEGLYQVEQASAIAHVAAHVPTLAPRLEPLLT